MKEFQKSKSERWVAAVAELARERGDGDGVWRRAIEITRRLNVAPWIGLAVAERRVTLAEAAQLERAARCQVLQAAVLDKHKPLAELLTAFPYAPHFLAADLADAVAERGWTSREAVGIAEALLALEKQLDAEGKALPVRRRPLAEYVAAARRMRALMSETGCEAAMAADVEHGKSDAAFVRAYMRQRNWFENPLRRDGFGPGDAAPPTRDSRRPGERREPERRGRRPPERAPHA